MDFVNLEKPCLTALLTVLSAATISAKAKRKTGALGTVPRLSAETEFASLERHNQHVLLTASAEMVFATVVKLLPTALLTARPVLVDLPMWLESTLPTQQ